MGRWTGCGERFVCGLGDGEGEFGLFLGFWGELRLAVKGSCLWSGPMHSFSMRVLLLWSLVSILNCGAEEPAQLVIPDPLYTQVEPHRDGIGKVFLGREISQIMGHQAAGWLERPNREREERTDLAVKALKLAVLGLRNQHGPAQGSAEP